MSQLDSNDKAPISTGHRNRNSAKDEIYREKLAICVKEYNDENSLLDLSDLEAKYSVSKSAIHRHVKKYRISSDESAIPITSERRGRKRTVSDSVLDIVVMKYRESCSAGALVSIKAIIDLIESERFLELGPDANLDTLKPMSRSVGRRAAAQIKRISTIAD